MNTSPSEATSDTRTRQTCQEARKQPSRAKTIGRMTAAVGGPLVEADCF